MGLFSIFQRKHASAPKAGATGLAADVSLVERARTSARRRLIGAVVLLGGGVVAFPIIFETQPRPIPVDIPIEIPRKESLPPLAIPAPKPTKPAALSSEAPREPVPPQPTASASAAVPASAPMPAAKDESRAEIKPEPKTEPKPAPKPEHKVEVKAEPKAESKAEVKNEAKAEAKPTAQGESAKFVVQVGAFAEAATVRDTRMKVEKLGLSTYTQAVDTAAGKRTRVRVGPFASREEADKAAAKLKAAGLPGAVLGL